MKRWLTTMGCAVLFLFSASGLAEEPKIAKIEVLEKPSLYYNGDAVYLSGFDFYENENISRVTLLFYDLEKNYLGSKSTDQHTVQISKDGTFEGEVLLEGIPGGVDYVDVLISAEKSFVRSSGILPVSGDPSLLLGDGGGDQIQGSLTITDSGDAGSDASPFEPLTLSGSMTGSAATSAFVTEYSDQAGTVSIQSSSVGVGSITVSGGSISGTVTNVSSYDASTLTIRLSVVSDGPDFATSNTLNAPDTQAPTMLTATATSTTIIQVTFSEDISEQGDATGRFSLGGTDAGGRSVSSISAVGGEPADTWDLTLSSALTDLNPDLDISYSRSGGNADELEDAAGNEVVTSPSAVVVSDEIAPTTPTLVTPDGSETYPTTVPMEVNADASTSSVTFQGSTNGTTYSNLSLSITNNGGGNFTATYTPGTKYHSYRVVASDPSSNSTNSSASVQLTDAYRIETTSTETPVSTNETAAITITIQDNYEDAEQYLFGLGSNYSLSSDGGGTFTSDDAGLNTITQVNIPGGQTAKTFYYKQATGGTATLVFTDIGGNLPDDDDTTQVTINAPTITGFALDASTPTAGSAFTIDLIAKNGTARQTSYVGNHTITITSNATDSPDGTSAVLPSNQVVSFSSGVGTVTGVTLYNSGETPQLTATDELTNSGDSTYTVNDGAAAEARVKTADDGGVDGEYDNNIYGTATYQGSTQGSVPDFTLYGHVYDAYGNLRANEGGVWTSTFGGNITYISSQNQYFMNVQMTGTGSEYSGTITYTSNTSSQVDATGTITVDDGIPGTTSGFSADNSNNDEFVVFEWNSSTSGDNGTSGSITSFQIRWATEGAGQIDDETKWGNATAAFNGSAANFANDIRNVDMSGFPSGNKYFALRTTDDVGNVSGISFTTSTDFSLPVSLTAFTATAGYGKIMLQWETASELNNEGFFIYRSTSENGVAEELVNQEIISGQGNTNAATQYEFEDTSVEAEQTYYYRLVSRDFDGTIHQSTIMASATVMALPQEFSLAQNYPNPFNPNTTFRFSVADFSTASLEIYNILGQKVRTLFSNTAFAPGVYENYQWDARDNNGSTVAGGIYYFVFTVKENNFREVRKMVFMK